MWLGIILAIILLFVLALLWMPIILCIDTRAKNYYLHFKGLAKASVEADKEEFIRIKMKVLLFSFYLYPLQKIGAPKKKKKKKPKTSHQRSKGRKMTMKRMLRILKTFRIRKFYLHVDTGDVLLNAKLFPLSALLDFTVGDIGVNFEGRNELALVVQNRPIRIIRSFINF